MSKSLIIKIFLSIFAIVILGAIIALRYVTPGDVRINEISFEENEGNDWIELYNTSLNTLSLKGLYLTDDGTDMKKYKITQDIVIPGHGYVVLYGKDSDHFDDHISLNFDIKNGETVYLLSSSEFVLDAMTAITQENFSGSIGRFPDGYEDVFVMSQATPGEANIKDMITQTKPR